VRRRLGLRSCALVAGASVLLAACGSQAATVQAPGSVPANFATILPRPSGGELIEVQSYQHGQVFVQRGAHLSLATPLGVSTRGGVVLAAAASTLGASTPVLAGEVAHGTWPDSVLWATSGGGWNPQDLATAVAPFPGSLVALPGGGEAIVGQRAFGTGRQAIVRVSAQGSIGSTVLGAAALARIAAHASCASLTLHALDPSGTTAVATCGSGRSVVLINVLRRSWQRVGLPGTPLATSAVAESSAGPVVAVLVAGGASEHLVLVDVATGAVIARATLGGAASAGPSIAASGATVAVLVPRGEAASLELISPVAPGEGAIVRSVAAPAFAQGVGFLPNGALEVVAGNPNATGIALFDRAGGHWSEVASATTPVVSQG